MKSEGSTYCLLESRHTTILEWYEPWPSCGPDGNLLDADVTLRATVHDCINMQRETDKQNGRPITGDDSERLEDFIAIHWAEVVEAPTKKE